MNYGKNMLNNLVSTVQKYLANEKKVKFAYLFGSMARNSAGPLSDIDIAVYLDGRVNVFTTRLLLMESLAKHLATERFDLIVLNRAPIVLKFEVIKYGKVLKEERPRRITFETLVLREYLDSAYLRRIQHDSLKKNLLKRAAHG